MNDIDILVTAALPPFLKDPLEADYRCHDYASAGDRDALLAQVGPRIRGLVQGGGTVTPPALLDRLPFLVDELQVDAEGGALRQGYSTARAYAPKALVHAIEGGGDLFWGAAAARSAGS